MVINGNPRSDANTAIASHGKAARESKRQSETDIVWTDTTLTWNGPARGGSGGPAPSSAFGTFSPARRGRRALQQKFASRRFSPALGRRALEQKFASRRFSPALGRRALERKFASRRFS